MIEMYTGTPGSGKSLHLAQTMAWGLRAGRPVVANFPYRGDLVYHGKDSVTGFPSVFFECSTCDLDPIKLREWALAYWGTKTVIEDHILLVIDEAQLLFNSREWAKKDRSAWLSFFTQHRKLGYRILLCCQFDQMLDKQIRACVEYQHIHRKISDGVWLARLVSLLFLNRLFVTVKVWYAMKETVDHEFFIAKKMYYRLYSTHALLDGGEAGTDSPFIGCPPPPGRVTRMRDAARRWRTSLILRVNNCIKKLHK